MLTSSKKYIVCIIIHCDINLSLVLTHGNFSDKPHENLMNLRRVIFSCY